jgi:hypothetical protein
MQNVSISKDQLEKIAQENDKIVLKTGLAVQRVDKIHKDSALFLDAFPTFLLCGTKEEIKAQLIKNLDAMLDAV